MLESNHTELMQLQHHKNLNEQHENKYDSQSDDSESCTFSTFDYGRVDTIMSQQIMGLQSSALDLYDNNKSNSPINDNPKHWDWNQVKLWLANKKLNQLIQVFDVENEITLKKGISGDELLQMTLNKLFDSSEPFDAASILDINDPIIEKLFREINNLELLSYQDSSKSDSKETTAKDLIEIQRRINAFIDKW
eukprot:8495_1